MSYGPMKLTALIVLLCLLVIPLGSSGRMTDPAGVQRSADSPDEQTADLAHVNPRRYALALENNPDRIFRFVRDRVRFESYKGVLRGPRGTLLALAGNSADQSLLLASMLKGAGYRVRFMRGRLSTAEARRLVQSIDAAHPRVTSATQPEPPQFRKTLDTLQRCVKRDYEEIRQRLKTAGVRPAGSVRFDLDALTAEAQDHVWVQVYRDGKWIDLDPTFPDAIPGKVYAKEAKPLDRLPKSMFHRVEIRIRVEEYTGTERRERTLLEVKSLAADLSGQDIVLTHQPENWKGPASSLQQAFASAITDTGRIKPVLVVGNKEWKAGLPFREKPPKQSGIGGVFNGLRGIGTRKAVPVATALWIEFTFIGPDGKKTVVRRELYDHIGPARRQSGKPFSESEIRTLTQSAGSFTVTEAVYSLFFTTGHIDGSHFPPSVSKKTPKKEKYPRIDTLLRRVHLAYAASADALTRRMPTGRKTAVRFYPDSPRVYIAELSKRGDYLQFTYDLRHDPARGISRDSRAEELFHGRILRGVIAGTVERIIVESLTTGVDRARGKGVGLVTTTSRIFDEADSGSRLLTSPTMPIPQRIDGDAQARIRTALRNKQIVLVPEKPIWIGARQRTAWWQIDPRTGETIAVVDDGLHGAASFEYHANVVQAEEEDTFIVHAYCGSNMIQRYTVSQANLGGLVEHLISQGFRIYYPHLIVL